MAGTQKQPPTLDYLRCKCLPRMQESQVLKNNTDTDARSDIFQISQVEKN